MAENKIFVVDSSFVLSYLLPDENLPKVEEVFMQYQGGLIEFISIKILPFEVFSGLCSALRSKRISKRLLKDLGNRLLKLNIQLIGVDYPAVSDLVISNNLSFYDACYFYLANKRKKPLLTFDKVLQKLA